MRQKLQKKMFNENDLEEVYVVGQITNDRNGEDTEKSDTEHDQRRLALPFYDADFRQVMDPISAQSGSTPQEDLNLTPEPGNVPRSAEISTVGTVPYNNANLRSQQRSGNMAAAQKKTKVPKPFDIFLAVSTAFFNSLPAISLEENKFKGSQQMLHFTKLPDNLNLPKDPQKVIEYKGWRTSAETFLNSYGSTLAIFKSRK